MSLKNYISPEFEWMFVELIEDSLNTSNPEIPEGSQGGDFDTDEESGEEDVNEATTPNFGWDDWEW